MAAKKKPEDYQKLKEVWYKKLERSGFVDIEKDEYNLKQYSFRFNQDAVVRSWHSKTEYYSMAGQFLNHYKFASNLEKTIWEYHVNGIGVRDIAKLLTKAKVRSIKPNKDNVQKVVSRLAEEMKKIYLPGYKK